MPCGNRTSWTWLYGHAKTLGITSLRYIYALFSWFALILSTSSQHVAAEDTIHRTESVLGLCSIYNARRRAATQSVRNTTICMSWFFGQRRHTIKCTTSVFRQEVGSFGMKGAADLYPWNMSNRVLWGGEFHVVLNSVCCCIRPHCEVWPDCRWSCICHCYQITIYSLDAHVCTVGDRERITWWSSLQPAQSW